MLFAAVADPAQAAHRKRAVVRMPASPTDPVKDAALIVDGVTGKVLYARNETAQRHPASLTKMTQSAGRPDHFGGYRHPRHRDPQRQ